MKTASPKSPETKPNVTPKKVDEQPKYAGLLKLVKKNLSELFEYGKQAVKLETAMDAAKATFVTCRKFGGKVMSAMQVAYTNDRNKSNISQDLSFDEYYEQKCGGKPNGRIQALGRFYNRFVIMGFVTETVYDAQTEDALCAATETYSLLEDKYKGTGTDVKTTEEFKKVVAALNGPGEAAKTIKGLKAEVKGTKTKDADKGEAEQGESREDFIKLSQLTPEIAMQLFDRIVTQGHIAACLVNLPDHVPAMGDEAQKSLVLALDTVQERVYAAIGGAAELWIADKVAKATLPSGIVHMKAGKPVAAAA